MNKVAKIVADLAEPVVKNAGCELWDVEYVKEAGSWYLRLYIDKDTGVNITDCETISRAMDPILDEEDPVPEQYIFEVCSAGCERELKRPSDFEKFMGSDIEVKFFSPVNGKKVLVGKLSSYSPNGDVTVSVGDNEETYTKKQIAQVRLRATI